MEPEINPDLTHKVEAPDDLTLELFRDVGWFADADLDGIADASDCRVHSNFSPTIVIGGEDTTSRTTVQQRLYDLRSHRQHRGQREESRRLRQRRGAFDECADWSGPD